MSNVKATDNLYVSTPSSSSSSSSLSIRTKLLQLFHASFKYILLILIFTTVFLYHELIIESTNLNYIQRFFIYNFSFLNENDKLMSEYKQIHENILNNKTKLKISFNESPSAGYANRLYSMLSSLVVALVSDSAIVIKWDRIDEFIEEPFVKMFDRFEKQQNEFNFRYKKENLLTLNTINQWSKYKDMKSLIQTKIPQDANRFYYNSINGYFFEICCNPIYYEKFYHYGLVNRNTIDKAFKLTKNMTANSNQVNQNIIIQVGFEVGGNLLNKMWIPKPFIKKQIDNYLNKTFHDYFMIGIQLRYQYISDGQDTSKFIDCALMIEKNRTKFIQDRNYKGVKWFVTSDRADILDRLVKSYPKKIIVGEGTIGHIELNKNSYSRSIMDIELLSNCNELVVTGGSTYGIIIKNIMISKIFGFKYF